jgi:hypothetical protein
LLIGYEHSGQALKPSGLNLPNSFPREANPLADFKQREFARRAVQTEARSQNLGVTVTERLQRNLSCVVEVP